MDEERNRVISVRQDEMGAMENVPSKSPQIEMEECGLSTPNVLNHLKSLEEEYSWMLYIEDECVVICKICDWGSRNPKESEVYELQTSKDIHLVAGKLKDHQDEDNHQKFIVKREKLSKICKHIYPLLKTSLQEGLSMGSIVDTVTSKFGGEFPGPEEPFAQFAFISFTIKCIANCIEEKLLNSLAESPFFSILTFENDEYAIIRWVNIKGEIEEHLFCSRISNSDESVSCISYLRKRHVNMKKLVSYTILPSDREPNLRNGVLHQVPVRTPHLKLLVNWLEEESFMEELFLLFNVITKLFKTCKMHNHVIDAFPGTAEWIAIEEPYSYNFIVNENLVNCFFEIISKMSDTCIARDNNEDYSFSAFLQNRDALFRCATLLHQLYVVILAHTSESDPACKTLIEFRNQVIAKLKDIKQSNSGEATVLSFVDNFLDLVITTQLSPGRNITDILARKLTTITAEDIDLLLSNLMEAYRGNSTYYLEKFLILQSCLSLSQDCSILELLERLDTKPELQQNYADLYQFHQKIKVLPSFPAKTEQSVFNVTALQILLSDRVDDRLKFAKTFIVLEGPSIAHLNIDLVLDAWSRRWMEGPQCRFNVPNRIG